MLPAASRKITKRMFRQMNSSKLNMAERDMVSGLYRQRDVVRATRDRDMPRLVKDGDRVSHKRGSLA